MTALKLYPILNEIELNMAELAPYRKATLFNEFLVKGYTAITLTSVPPKFFSELLKAKICLGTLITLYDDFADRPSQSDPKLLEKLYQLNFEKHDCSKAFDCHESHVLQFASTLFTQMKFVLTRLPNYKEFKDVLNFDLLQFYSANRYSSLVTAFPSLNNLSENRVYSHHNMGMVMVSMMDLMATPKFQDSEFGAIREVFILGQRMGRIFNVLTTYHREVADGDVTGELAFCNSISEIINAKQDLRNEILELRRKILNYETQITSFSVSGYLEGLIEVQKLHEQMEGEI